MEKRLQRMAQTLVSGPSMLDALGLALHSCLCLGPGLVLLLVAWATLRCCCSTSGKRHQVGRRHQASPRQEAWQCREAGDLGVLPALWDGTQGLSVGSAGARLTGVLLSASRSALGAEAGEGTGQSMKQVELSSAPALAPACAGIPQAPAAARGWAMSKLGAARPHLQRPLATWTRRRARPSRHLLMALCVPHLLQMLSQALMAAGAA